MTTHGPSIYAGLCSVRSESIITMTLPFLCPPLDVPVCLHHLFQRVYPIDDRLQGTRLGEIPEQIQVRRPHRGKASSTEIRPCRPGARTRRASDDACALFRSSHGVEITS